MKYPHKHKRIIVAPLDWGLGHASRCIPVIRELNRQGAHIVIVADGRPLSLLKDEFPQCESVRLPGMGVSYPKHMPMSVFMALKAPRFFKTIAEEHKSLKHLVKNYQIDGVISDNRYGLYHKKVPSILITHQLFIQAPFFKGLLKRLTASYIEKYQSCWVPDFKGSENLSGDLSHQSNELQQLRFIGPLSRFMDQPQLEEKTVFKRKLMVILSGPEPSRSDFEKQILKQLEAVDYEVLLVRGLVGSGDHTDSFNMGNIKLKAFLSSDEMRREMLDSEVILCRAGYSSVMDLAILGKQAILVPTEGQTEQEYLAKHLRAKNWFYTCDEKNLDLNHDLKKALSFPGVKVESNNDRLSKAVTDFLESC